LRVEHHIDLLAGESLFDKDIDQARESNFAATAVNDCDDFCAWRADPPNEPGALMAIDTAHRGRL
jgi:hypothetical protein